MSEQLKKIMIMANRIVELEEQNKEMLEYIIDDFKCDGLECKECDYMKPRGNCSFIGKNEKLIEKITGKSIEENLK